MIICRSIEDFLEKLKNNNMSELDFDDSNKYKELVEYLTKNLNYDKDGFYAYVLGNCFYYGKGIEQDYEKAVYYYKLGAKKGNSSAQYYLGDCYYSGYGVIKNYKKAVYYYELAAKQGHKKAREFLIKCNKIEEERKRERLEAQRQRELEEEIASYPAPDFSSSFFSNKLDLPHNFLWRYGLY